MQNNLEGIGFDEVTDSAGTCYTTFRDSLLPNYARVAFDISKGYFFLHPVPIDRLQTIYPPNYYSFSTGA